MPAPILILGDHELGRDLLDVTNPNLCTRLLGPLAEHACQRMNVPRGAVIDDRYARFHCDPAEHPALRVFSVELGKEGACATNVGSNFLWRPVSERLAFDRGRIETEALE